MKQVFTPVFLAIFLTCTVSFAAPNQPPTLQQSTDFKEELIKKAQDTSETIEIRASAIFALRSYVGEPDVRVLVQNLAEKDYNPIVRAISFRTLARAIWDEDVLILLQRRTRKEYDLGVKIEIYRALARVQNNNVIHQFLLSELRKNADLAIKVAIINSLFPAVAEGYQDAIVTLKNLLRDSNAPIRLAALSVLSQDCDYFGHWICPEKPEGACQTTNPLLPHLWCP